MTRENARIIERLEQSFMIPEVEHCQYWEVSVDHGSTCYVPADVCGQDELVDYVDGTIDSNEDGLLLAELKTGYLARLSAPGYLDCTDWTAHETEDEAYEYLANTYGDDLPDDDDDEPTEPGEEDITTSDHRSFYYCGKVIVCVPMDDEFSPKPWEPFVAAWCKANGYFPNVWWISDHGNALLISVADDGRYLGGFAD